MQKPTPTLEFALCCLRPPSHKEMVYQMKLELFRRISPWPWLREQESQISWHYSCSLLILVFYFSVLRLDKNFIFVEEI
jgi:hypothetical protein